MSAGRSKANVNAPLKLLEVGTWTRAEFAAPSSLEVERIVPATKSGAEVKIVEVEDGGEARRAET